MAKNNKTAAEVAAEQEADRQERLANRTYMSKVGSGDEEWDKIEGTEIGGQSDILELEVGEFVTDIKYVGHQVMTMEGGKTVTVHMGALGSDTFRLPIAASFLRSVDQARVQVGDTFAMKRYDDVVKKQGVGKGQNMHIYAIKVTNRIADGEAVAH